MKGTEQGWFLQDHVFCASLQKQTRQLLIQKAIFKTCAACPDNHSASHSYQRQSSNKLKPGEGKVSKAEVCVLGTGDWEPTDCSKMDQTKGSFLKKHHSKQQNTRHMSNVFFYYFPDFFSLKMKEETLEHCNRCRRTNYGILSKWKLKTKVFPFLLVLPFNPAYHKFH